MVPSFAELLKISKSIITLGEQIDQGEIGRWCYPIYSRKPRSSLEVRSLVPGPGAGFLPLAEPSFC